MRGGEKGGKGRARKIFHLTLHTTGYLYTLLTPPTPHPSLSYQKNVRDKRADIKDRDIKRETQRTIKNFNR